MKNFRYLTGVATISHDSMVCKGCRMCEKVCPHQVLKVKGKKAEIVDKDGCMECGACVINCRSGAISVTPGVGCATYIISSWIHGKEDATCDCGC